MRLTLPIPVSSAVIVLDSNLNVLCTTSSLDAYKGELHLEAHYLVSCNHGNASKVKVRKDDGSHLWETCPTPGKD